MKQKKILFPGKLDDSVLIQLEMAHNLIQMFQMQDVQGATSKISNQSKHV